MIKNKMNEKQNEKEHKNFDERLIKIETNVQWIKKINWTILTFTGIDLLLLILKLR